jgi:hypothetical protein
MWLAEMFPDVMSARVEHLFDRGNKRVAAWKLVRFHDLVIHHEHQREVEPDAAGRCLARLSRKAPSSCRTSTTRSNSSSPA